MNSEVDVMETQPTGKRKGTSKPIPPSKRAKTEVQSKAPPPTSEARPKRGKCPSKLPFSEVRPLISPLIYNEKQCRLYNFDDEEQLAAA